MAPTRRLASRHKLVLVGLPSRSTSTKTSSLDSRRDCKIREASPQDFSLMKSSARPRLVLAFRSVGKVIASDALPFLPGSSITPPKSPPPWGTRTLRAIGGGAGGAGGGGTWAKTGAQSSAQAPKQAISKIPNARRALDIGLFLRPRG